MYVWCQSGAAADPATVSGGAECGGSTTAAPAAGATTTHGNTQTGQIHTIYPELSFIYPIQ